MKRDMSVFLYDLILLLSSKHYFLTFMIVFIDFLILFIAINEGSVCMQENEEMWVLEQDQGDGWTRVRKNDSSEGFVPTSYVQCHYYDQDAV